MEIQVGNIVYERGNMQSNKMTAESISNGIVLCSWTANKKRFEREFDIEALTTTHPKFGNPIPE